MNTQKLLKPERAENEKFSDYKIRRIAAQNHVKNVLRGSVFWNSSMQGTYRNPASALRKVKQAS